MLPASHDRAYQDFLTLLTKFMEVTAKTQSKGENLSSAREFENLSSWFGQHVARLDERNIEPASSARWQSVQTEILREFKLLSTDILFLASARQNLTRQKRLKNIEKRLTKLIGYCQIMLGNPNN